MSGNRKTTKSLEYNRKPNDFEYIRGFDEYIDIDIFQILLFDIDIFQNHLIDIDIFEITLLISVWIWIFSKVNYPRSYIHLRWRFSMMMMMLMAYQQIPMVGIFHVVDACDDFEIVICTMMLKNLKNMKYTGKE